MARPPANPTLPATPIHVLVTGAAGRIGSAFAEFAKGRYRLRLMVMPGEENTDRLKPFGEVVEGDLADLAQIKELMVGVDACVHLAGDPDPAATWDALLKTNVTGTYHVYVAAKAAGCHRVIYASSIHAVSGYPSDVQVKANEPVNPGDLYGVSKCFGEALGRYMAEQEGVGGVAIRIGAYQPENKIADENGIWALDSWVSPRDLNQLICRSIETTSVTFAVVHGVSDNRFKRLDITNARELLGYAPEDDATRTNATVAPLELNDAAVEHSLSDSDNPSETSGLRKDLSSL